MKIEICNTPHPLTRDGSSQPQRRLRELHPRSARVDDRLLSDLLNFAKHYAEQVQYYNQQNQGDGNWQSFFDKDSASQLADIASRDLGAYRQLTELLHQYITDAQDHTKLAKSGVFGLSFDLLFYLAIEFNRYLQKAAEMSLLKQQLLRLLDAGLQQILKDAVATFNYAADFAWFNDSPTFTYDLSFDRSQLIQQTLSHHWQATNGSKNLQEWIALGEKDHRLFDYSSVNPLSNLQHAGHALLTWVDSFLQALSQLIDAAPNYLFQVVHRQADHKAHMALYLAFVRLFKFAQIQLNKLTGRHLDFYYERVLQFELQPAVSDSVHLLFELAKPIEQHLLAAGTQFKAGFDKDGNPVFYQLDEETALNKAVIDAPEDIKSVFIERDENSQGHVFKAPIANSADGLGTEFESAPKWPAFAKAEIAEMGFALASPLLDLREGERVIKLSLALSSSMGITLDKAQFSARATTEKGWIDIPIVELSLEEDTLFFKLSLSPTLPSLVNFDAAIHAPRNYTSSQPVVEIALPPEPEGFDYAYPALAKVDFKQLYLVVEAQQLSNLIVQNDNGKLDINGPIQAFGPRPAVGNNCYISCAEIQGKPVSRIELEYQWLDKPENFASYYQAYNYAIAPDPDKALDAVLANPDINRVNLPDATLAMLGANTPAATSATSAAPEYNFSDGAFTATLSALNQASWSEFGTAALFVADENGQLKISIEAAKDVYDNPIPLFDFDAAITGAEQFSKNLKQGFIRWQLSSPNQAFGHKVFAPIYAKRVALLTSDSNTLVPNEPYTPVLSSLKLNYAAELNLSTQMLTEASGVQFFHLTPFGSASQQNGSTLPLLHSFTQTVDGEQKDTQGELYIGLSQVKPPQMVSLLFQVAEGSANPELSRQPIYWSVLVNNQWQALTAKQVVSDGTNALNRSGIIKLILPTEAQADADLLATGKVWLRLSVLKDIGAVNDIISIATQAATASFSDQNNTEDFLTTPLAAGSIGKLAVKQSQLKKVSQPFAAQKGKPPEQLNAFRTRVSERLRHKDRGVSIWDYEKLVLQSFPSIYKAKCINHSTYLFERSEDERFTSEFAPGYVSLVVIPDLTNQHALNPLEPKVSLDSISEIEDFLRARISPFAAPKLKVVNPLYETVQLEFTVSFQHGIDPAIYIETLNQALVAFLSPWAFPQQQGGDIHFGGKIHRSELVNFVEEQPYVDYLTDVKMHQQIGSADIIGSEISADDQRDILEATPHSARSILVSHPQHQITLGDPC